MDATPFVSAAVPSVFAPSVKVTLPVGVPTAATTEAVSVTDWPYVIGLLDASTVVVVGSVPTDCTSGGDVEDEKFPSLLYCTVMEWPPTDSAEVVNDAAPEESRLTVPNDVAPSRNVSVPVGVPAELVTVAD